MSPATDDMFTIAPPPDFSMCGISYFIDRNTPFRLTSMTSSQTCSGVVGSRNKGCAADPGVVEREIQTLPAAHGRVHQILDLIGASDVGRHEDRFAALGLNLADGFLAFGRAPRSDRHASAFRRERDGRGPADTRTAAGDDGDLTFEEFAHIR